MKQGFVIKYLNYNYFTPLVLIVSMGFTRFVNNNPKTAYQVIPPLTLKAHAFNDALFGRNNTNYEQLKQSIVKNGFLQQYPIVCSKKRQCYTILCGHRRCKIAIELGISKVPVVVIDINDEDIESYMIEDNLQHPQEARSYSNLERFILALQLRSLRRSKRGGDRKSIDFMELTSAKASREIEKNEIAETVGMGTTYLRYYSVVSRRILQDLTENHPELSNKEPHQQLTIALDRDLSQELSGLARDVIPIVALYSKYCTKKNKALKIADCEDTKVIQSGTNSDATNQIAPIVEVQMVPTQVSTLPTSIFSEINDICNALNAINVAELPDESIHRLWKTIDKVRKKIHEIKKAVEEKKELTLPLFAVKTTL